MEFKPNEKVLFFHSKSNTWIKGMIDSIGTFDPPAVTGYRIKCEDGKFHYVGFGGEEKFLKKEE
jgi:hypothetical protein